MLLAEIQSGHFFPLFLGVKYHKMYGLYQLPLLPFVERSSERLLAIFFFFNCYCLAVLSNMCLLKGKNSHWKILWGGETSFFFIRNFPNCWFVNSFANATALIPATTFRVLFFFLFFLKQSRVTCDSQLTPIKYINLCDCLLLKFLFGSLNWFSSTSQIQYWDIFFLWGL